MISTVIHEALNLEGEGLLRIQVIFILNTKSFKMWSNKFFHEKQKKLETKRFKKTYKNNPLIIFF